MHCNYRFMNLELLGLTRGVSFRSGRLGEPLWGREGGIKEAGCSFWAADRSARPLTSTSTAAASPHRTARYLRMGRAQLLTLICTHIELK